MYQILNAQRLVQLSQFHPNLRDLWYLVAAVTFSVCNQPQEIPKLYHYALRLQSDELGRGRDPMPIAHSTCELVRTESHKLRSSIDELYSQPSLRQRQLTIKFREALLKAGPLAGLPKSINVLSQLKDVTPTSLLPETKPIDPWKAAKGDENVCPTARRQDSQSQEAITQRGLEHWNHLYTKVSTRIVNNLNSSYPDLWYYILVHVYGPILSYDEILSAQETSLMVIAALVPQDVNPQLKGHLKGAINVGCDPETVEAARSMAVTVSKWCGVNWRSEVIKL
ncbi:hypothetical protein ZYGR_0AD05200 [Zygosaccharomyces rouxii]|uniref:Carboxymuconolactone decarboxylase-like domain-containing protein n=1 Tax=Zygosaccharomyces rouxii TaxID=4956 RepID=A0A1Q3A6Q1_ZYGRO|nr:hypothetical protein ZYGR_0AD05200 [Zygosaccharomyces rouxii]